MALFRKFGINVNDNHNANRVDNLLRLKLKSRSFLNGSFARMCLCRNGARRGVRRKRSMK